MRLARGIVPGNDLNEAKRLNDWNDWNWLRFRESL
jgi:hypothetical protein